MGTYLRHGLPCLAVWCLYLAGFWPGLLTEDSFEQWRDLVTGELRGYHSPLQTAINWLITRVWLSPAPIALAQIVALALAYCAVVRECERRHASPRWLAATTVVFALLPANGFLVVTLWKDVPYTIAVLGLVALSLRLIRAPASLPEGAMPWVLAGTLTAVATFRHNGLPTAGLFLVALIWALRPPLRTAVRVVGVSCAGVLLVQVGLFRLLDVRPFHAAYRDQLVLHQIAAAMRPGTAFDQADFAAIGRAMPMATWLASYRCESVIPTLSGVLEHNDEAQYAAVRPQLYRAWTHALTRTPQAIARHHACVSAMFWNPGASVYLVATEIVPNGFGMQTRPLLPVAHQALLGLHAATTRMPWRSVVWGPALHLWMLLGGVAYVATRTRSRASLLPFAPAVAHGLVLFLAIPSAEYRLQYPVVLMGVLTPLLAHALGRAERAQRIDR
ncbi:MAG: hypothetical protein ABIT71_08620 [Vicinamibacteraceae bacterium]